MYGARLWGPLECKTFFSLKEGTTGLGIDRRPDLGHKIKPRLTWHIGPDNHQLNLMLYMASQPLQASQG